MGQKHKKNRSLQARIVAGSVVLLSGSGLTTAINLAYNLFVARALGPDGFGQAAAVYTLLTLLSALTLAYQMVAAKTTARQKSDGPNAGQEVGGVQQSAWLCGLMVAAVLFAARQQIVAFLHLSDPRLVWLLATAALFYIPLGARRGIVQGSEGFHGLARNLILEGASRLLGSMLLVAMGWGVVGVMAANAGAMVVAYFALRTPAGIGVEGSWRLGPLHREVAHTVVFFAGQVLINNCDIVLVKHFFAPGQAGVYAVLAMVGRVLYSLSQAVINSMVPVVAATRAEERNSTRLASTSVVIVASLGAAVSAGLYLAPAWLWSRLFGAGFYLPGRFGVSFLLALYASTTAVYALTSVLITYEMSYRRANKSWVQLLFSGLIAAGICRFHSSLAEVIAVQLVLVTLLLLAVAMMFALGEARERKALALKALAPLELLRRVSEDEVILGFLRSDFYKPCYDPHHRHMGMLMAEGADLNSAAECAQRRALLMTRHAALWSELPADTQWYEAKLQVQDLSRVRVFPRAQWRKLAGGQFSIQRIASHIEKRGLGSGQPFFEKIQSLRECLAAGRAKETSVLLVGVDCEQPLVILDGNHRFVAAVMEGQLHQLQFYCGLSPRMTRCCWYRTNLFTLARYGLHLLGLALRDPQRELQKIMQEITLPVGQEVVFESKSVTLKINS